VTVLFDMKCVPMFRTNEGGGLEERNAVAPTSYQWKETGEGSEVEKLEEP
jgi:hypothetical protein